MLSVCRPDAGLFTEDQNAARIALVCPTVFLSAQTQFLSVTNSVFVCIRLCLIGAAVHPFKYGLFDRIAARVLMHGCRCIQKPAALLAAG